MEKQEITAVLITVIIIAVIGVMAAGTLRRMASTRTSRPEKIYVQYL